MMQQRIGLGYDIHRLRAGSGLPLGGVFIPCEHEVIAHSDGDVVLHAICDALLGALALGDIGEHFPDNDPAHQDQASSYFVKHILNLPAYSDWQIGNVDVNIIAEAPRLSAHKSDIRTHIASILSIDEDQVSVKARSHEGLDAIGQKQAIAAQAVLLLSKNNS